MFEKNVGLVTVPDAMIGIFNYMSQHGYKQIDKDYHDTDTPCLIVAFLESFKGSSYEPQLLQAFTTICLMRTNTITSVNKIKEVRDGLSKLKKITEKECLPMV